MYFPLQESRYLSENRLVHWTWSPSTNRFRWWIDQERSLEIGSLLLLFPKKERKKNAQHTVLLCRLTTLSAEKRPRWRPWNETCNLYEWRGDCVSTVRKTGYTDAVSDPLIETDLFFLSSFFFFHTGHPRNYERQIIYLNSKKETRVRVYLVVSYSKANELISYNFLIS